MASEAIRPALHPAVVAATRAASNAARLNELRVATVRFGGYCIATTIDGVLVAAHARAAEHLVTVTLAAVVSGVMWAAVRRRFFTWYRAVVPLVDATLIGLILRTRIHEAGQVDIGTASVAAAVCTLMAASGAVRLDPASALWTTALAALVLGWTLAGSMDLASVLFSLLALVGVGVLGAFLAAVARSSREGLGTSTILRRFLPKPIVQDPLALLQQPRTVEATVLMSDVRGFTTLSETRSAAEVFAFLNGLHGELARVVEDSGGVVDKFLGDGMLAVFGVSDPSANHAQQALRAARGIRAAVERMNATGALGVTVAVGLGVHTGSLVAGCIGSGERLEFTVVGDTVNTASRLESMTKELRTDVLVSEATARKAEDATVEPLGEVSLRGKQVPLRIFRLTA